MSPKGVNTLEHYKTAIERLEKELETARLQLAVCGVVAMADTPQSAKVANDEGGVYECLL